MDLQELLEAGLLALQDRKNNDEAYASAMRPIVQEQIPTEIRRLLRGDGTTKGSIGEGNLASIPWCAAFLGDQRPAATQGTYVVYLFAEDGSCVYLTLAQASSEVQAQETKSALRKRALDRRAAAGDPSGFDHSIELNSHTTLGRSYESGVVLSIRYERDSIPTQEVLTHDFNKMMDCYRSIVNSEIDLDNAEEPTHLILRWSPDKEFDTIQLHDDVVTQMGSVWWGKMSTSANQGISESKLRKFEKQIKSGSLTKVFLVQGSEVWVSQMHDISLNASNIPINLMPSYYNKEQCNLFVKLGPINRLQENMDEILVLETKPDLGSVSNALKGRSSLIYAYELWRPNMTSQLSNLNGHSLKQSLKGLAAEIQWPLAEVQELIDVLRGSLPQVVLSGPPGTGKTFTARAVANYLTAGNHDQVTTVQFHPSYGYEDFVEGLRPEVNQDGQLTFNRVDGHLLQIIQKMTSSEDSYVLIIDEMNRANLPKVLGELLYLLEYRGEKIQLMHSGEFSIPKNLVIIGTMNNADRSTGRLDAALRRRFVFFDCPPSVEAIEAHYSDPKNTCKVPDLAKGLRGLNQEISNDLDEHHQIGHTFFMGENFDDEQLRRTWRRQIQPLLAEYFYDDPEKLEGYSMERFWPSSAN